MDADEPYLRPCKQLPSPTYDRQASHPSMGQHLGVQSSSQGHVEQDTYDSSPSIGQEDTEDETSELEHGPSKDAPEYATRETSEAKVARLLKGKEKEWAAAAQQRGPLRLLNLPLDILKIILKEVTHTNDLANCAKVNSTMHSLVTPMIYSRFDIVWPETQSSADSARGVDALTYGLATLVMREDLFATLVYPTNNPCGVACQSISCPHCGSISYLSKDVDNEVGSRISRRGNYFSQFVKKFSLGNGPTDWVQEYLVTKESGKMLGTLVALSIARMPNLETFVWDMPTGVLRDIWIALSSLGDHRQSKLEKLWIRFHDNHTALNDAGLLRPTVTTQAPQGIPGAAITLPPTQQSSLMDPVQYGVKKIVWIDNHVETPSFSIMPPLSSLTVLSIDEVQYLHELNVLLARSLSTLRELRVGMASTLNIPPSAQNNADATPLFNGGVFALLMGKIYDHTKFTGAMDLDSSKFNGNSTEPIKPVGGHTEDGATSANSNWIMSQMMNSQPRNAGKVSQDGLNTDGAKSPVSALANQVADVALDAIDPALVGASQPASHNGKLPEQGPKEMLQGGQATKAKVASDKSLSSANDSGATAVAGPLYATERLKLEVLEIEKFTKISPSILSKVIDLTVLTTLTLLQCGDCSSLWDRLRRDFAPRISRSTLGMIQKTKEPGQQPHSRRKKSSESLQSDVEYRLRLKRIHTDTVSSDLILFLKNTLAPNSLEWLFLRDTEMLPSPVTLEAIHRGPIRRHRSSLTKFMVDSAYGSSTSRLRINTARKWMLNRDILAFITSGKMCKLRELAFALEYKDWHFFLQRLPNIPHLRSLYVPNMSDHPYGNSLKVRDFALGAIDVVALRPEVELCYLGIKDKCFEISEKKVKNVPKGKTPSSADPVSDEDTEDGDHHDDGDDDDSDDEGTAPAAPVIEPGAMDSDTGSITTEEEDEGSDGAGGTKTTKLKLRDILFYDDKISIFKARHGRL